MSIAKLKAAGTCSNPFAILTYSRVVIFHSPEPVSSSERLERIAVSRVMFDTVINSQ